MRQWHGDDHYAVEKVARFANLFLERMQLIDACTHLRACDLSTNLYNALTFEAVLDQQINESLTLSQPFSLVTLQFEPWGVLHARFTPRQLRNYHQELVQGIHRLLPNDVVTGLLAENRLAFLFKRSGLNELEPILARFSSNWHKGPLKITGKLQLSLRWGAVTYPMDGDTSDQLWTLAHQRLFAHGLPHDSGSPAT
jgi:hypothetical protein